MRRLLVLASAVILGSIGIAHANTINTFNLSATLADGSATGTLTLDATTGKFINSNVKIVASAGTGTFTGVPASTTSGTGYTSNIFNIPTTPYTFDLVLPFASLTNYTGGSLCTLTALCSLRDSGIESAGLNVDAVTSGTLTLVSSVAVTPEPSGLILLGTGVLVVGGFLRKRTV